MTQGKKNYLDKKNVELDRYQVGYMLGYIEWLHTYLNNKVTLGIKQGKHVSDKEVEAQVLYHMFKMRVLEFETCHNQLHEDNAKQIA